MIQIRIDEAIASGAVGVTVCLAGRAQGIPAQYMCTKPRGGRAGVANITTAVAKAMHRRREGLKSSWGIILK